MGRWSKRDQALHFADPLIRGGGQERGARAGTENVAGIVGFGAAAAAAMARHGRRRRAHAWLHCATGWRRASRRGCRRRSCSARKATRLPNTTLFAVPGIKAETAVIALDLDGIAVSSGSACSSGKVQPSHVLAAMGVAPPLGARRHSGQPRPDHDGIRDRSLP